MRALGRAPLRRVCCPPRRWRSARSKQQQEQQEGAGGAAEAAEWAVAAPCGPVEMEVKNSVFLASAAPARSDQEARAFRDEVRDRSASHNCWGWRGRGFEERCSDDGEPKGTAGEPIAAVLRRRRLRDTVVVVTRHFGGVKLGTGGLVSAYGKAAEAVLDAAELAPLQPS
eukprot:TRINITY_DN25556_c0_g1_i2.p3 TRINITY_DN25556_c0_g1~~TRINITY_DN25556_c0_g1_i2.p3  ORF type:complete len:170 (+),score=44.65 TRINITY_DN25556_c0_g1_i2:76-585(+)